MYGVSGSWIRSGIGQFLVLKVQEVSQSSVQEAARVKPGMHERLAWHHPQVLETAQPSQVDSALHSVKYGYYDSSHTYASMASVFGPYTLASGDVPK
jgi:hypothetical protein